MDIYNSSVREVVCVSNKNNGILACDENSPLLEVGKFYTVKSIEVYGYKTEVEVEEFPNIKFNSNCFKEKADDRLEKENLDKIRGEIAFQLAVSEATGNNNICINKEYGRIFMSLLEEKYKEGEDK